MNIQLKNEDLDAFIEYLDLDEDTILILHQWIGKAIADAYFVERNGATPEEMYEALGIEKMEKLRDKLEEILNSRGIEVPYSIKIPEEDNQPVAEDNES